MATMPLGPRAVAANTPFPVPMPAVTRILSRCRRPQLESFIAVAIDLLDTVDGDNDLEPDGDELDGSHSEEDFANFNAFGSGPGCTIADPDAEHDGREPTDGY